MGLRRILFAWLICLGAATSLQARNLALVVGIDSYENLPSLVRAVEDATGYAALFTELGYEVTTLINPGSTDFRLELARFYDSISEGDIVAFVYAGHGWSDGSHNYLVPADTPEALSATEASIFTLPLRNGQNGILDEISRRGASLSLAIIDACRDNPFARGDTRTLGLVGGLAPVEAPEGAFIVYSAGANQTALDRLGAADNFQYSVFTRFFLPNLREFGDLRRAIVVTRSQVQEAASIINHNQRPAYYDELSGTACLVGGCDAPVVEAAPVQAAPVQVAPEASVFAQSEWELVQFSTDVALLGAYIDRYRETVPEMATQAQARIDALMAEPAPASPPTEPDNLGMADAVVAEAAIPETAPGGALANDLAEESPADAIQASTEVSRTNVLATLPAPQHTTPPVGMAPATRGIIEECDSIAAMRGNPDNPVGVHGHLSIANVAAEAVVICESAARNRPDIARMRFNLALALYDRAELGDFVRVRDIALQLLQEDYLPAGFLLGNVYYFGLEVEADPDLATDYLRQADAGGLVAATANLAYLDLIEDHSHHVRDRALGRLNQLVKENDPTAQHLLGLALLFGEGVSQNPARGLELSELAGQQGHAYAYEAIAEYFEYRNDGAPEDIALALQYYDKAIAAGSATADFHVGNIYFEGNGVAVDFRRAFSHYQSAARLNHAEAYNNLAFMYENGHYVDADLNEAVALYEISFELGSAVAAYNLGIVYLEGIGVPINYVRAADMLMTALEWGEGMVIDEMELDLPPEFLAEFQLLLQKRGFYSGPIDGIVTPAQIAAMERICDCAE